MALTDIFAHLDDADFEVTSPQSAFYNCIAYAAGDTSQKWWPNAPTYWPIEREESVENFMKAFKTLGYEETPTPDLEVGFEKVAIYADADNSPTHMARQLESGAWTSKLGDLEDIQHTTLDQLNGFSTDDYGRAVKFMRRRRGHRNVG